MGTRGRECEEDMNRKEGWGKTENVRRGEEDRKGSKE